jgi:hypothetical protein
MMEEEWLACPDPQRMLVSLGTRPYASKYRLFAVACCQRI